jgi:putative NIF3 family GTP cyclohydrolase 1 type 2
MAQTGQLTHFLDELLTPEAFDDLGPNGLQVPGPATVERVVTGVTAQRALFERAIAAEAQLVLVHHGLFWNFHPVGLTPLLAERLRPLFKHDIALAAYHLPLDAHAEVGNNALLAEALGASEHVPFTDVGRGATFA